MSLYFTNAMKRKKKTQADHHSNTLYIFQQYLSNPERVRGRGGMLDDLRGEVEVLAMVVVVCVFVCVCVCVSWGLGSGW